MAKLFDKETVKQSLDVARDEAVKQHINEIYVLFIEQAETDEMVCELTQVVDSYVDLWKGKVGNWPDRLTRQCRNCTNFAIAHHYSNGFDYWCSNRLEIGRVKVSELPQERIYQPNRCLSYKQRTGTSYLPGESKWLTQSQPS